MNAPAALDLTRRLDAAWVVLGDTTRRAQLTAELAAHGWRGVREFSGPRQAITQLQRDRRPPQVIITGLHFPSGDGFDLMRELAGLPSPPAVFVFSHQQRAVIRTATELARARGLVVAGDADFLTAPAAVVATVTGFALARGEPAAPAAPAPLAPDALRAMVASRQIVTFLQPKVRLDTGEVSGFEALMRGVDAAGAIVGPDRFIGGLADGGLLAEVTVQAFAQIIDFLGRCLSNGYPVSASLNASLGLIADAAFCGDLVDMADRAGIDPSWITIEITETEAMSDLPTVMERTARVRMRGFNLSIDDFGTAYSSFMQLSQLPFSELKLERGFIAGSHLDPRKQAIVHACATLGTRLGLSVVAEGIESPQDLAAVRAAGCTHGQGYLFARPMPAARACEWLFACRGSALSAA